jgi:hypothetical protein
MDKKKFRRPIKSEAISVDEIITMSDDDLQMRLERLRSEIDRTRSRGDNAVHLEMDFCYLQRERQVREARGYAHYSYQQRLAEEDRQEYLREQHLPEYKPEPPPKRLWNS